MRMDAPDAHQVAYPERPIDQDVPAPAAHPHKEQPVAVHCVALQLVGELRSAEDLDCQQRQKEGFWFTELWKTGTPC